MLSLVCLQVYRGDIADPIRQAQEFETGAGHVDLDLGPVGGHLVSDRLRHELHGATDGHRLRLLQLRLPHLLLHGLLLHPMHRHDAPLLAHL